VTEPTGELYDLGYVHYDGPREGRMRARKAVYSNGVRTVLGLGRGPLAKALPILLFGAAMAPAVILALIASQVEGLDVPGHSDYYQIVSIILILFSAMIAPELLCPDRRSGVLSLYLVRPLTSTDYVAGRWMAFFSITLLLVYSGQILLFAGFLLSADAPLDYLRDNWLDVPRFLGAGIVVALFTTTLPLAVSAFTVRRAYAAAFVIGFFIISAAAGGILTGCEDEEHGPRAESAECEPLTGDAAKWFGLVGMGQVPIHVSDMIFGVEGDSGLTGEVAKLPAIIPIGWYLLLTGGMAFVLVWRYRRIAA
jgi:ABC-2 type transport system permease protein